MRQRAVVVGDRVRIAPRIECKLHYFGDGTPFPGNAPGAEGVVVEISSGGSHRYFVSDAGDGPKYNAVDTSLNRNEFELVETGPVTG